MNDADEAFVRRFRQAARDEWWGCVSQPEPIQPKPSRALTFMQSYGGHVLGVVVLAVAVVLMGLWK